MPLDVALPLSVVSLSIIYSLCIHSPSICVSFLTAVFIRHHNNTGHYSQLQCGRPTLTILIHTVSYTCFPLFPSFLFTTPSSSSAFFLPFPLLSLFPSSLLNLEPLICFLSVRYPLPKPLSLVFSFQSVSQSTFPSFLSHYVPP